MGRIVTDVGEPGVFCPDFFCGFQSLVKIEVSAVGSWPESVNNKMLQRAVVFNSLVAVIWDSAYVGEIGKLFVENVACAQSRTVLQINGNNLQSFNYQRGVCGIGRHAVQVYVGNTSAFFVAYEHVVEAGLKILQGLVVSVDVNWNCAARFSGAGWAGA